MKLLVLALKDLVRKRGKTLYILVALAIPVTILSTIMLTVSTADNSLSRMASKFGFTLTVQPKNIRIDRLDQIGVIVGDYMSEHAVPEIAAIIDKNTRGRKAGEENGALIIPRVYHKLEEGEQAGTVVAGVDFRPELDARSTWLLEMGRWPEGKDEAVLGGTYARSKNLKPGDRLSVDGGEFTVVGVLLVTNSSDDYMVFIPIRKAQSLFGQEGFVSVINVRSVALDKDRDLLKKTIEELNGSIANIRAISPQQFTAMKYVFIRKTIKFLLSIALATVAVSIFSVFSIVTGALYSRVKEIGLLKSVGASRLQLLKLFLYEYLILGLTGGVAGFLLGIGMSYLLNASFLQIGAEVNVSLLVILAALLLGVLCSLVASFYPTYKLSKIKVIETFKTQWEV